MFIFSNLRKYKSWFKWIIENSNDILFYAVYICGNISGSFFYIYNQNTQTIFNSDTMSVKLILFTFLSVTYILTTTFGLSFVASPFNSLLSFCNGFVFSYYIFHILTQNLHENHFIVAVTILIYGLIITLVETALQQSDKV